MAIINGTGGNDTLSGTSSDDTINGLGGDDTLSGGAGHDTLDGGTGADNMSGGTGNDTYVVDDSGDVVNENSGDGNDTVRTTLASYILTANVENLEFIGSGDFTGDGNSLDNNIYGAAGSDVLSGHDGHDVLSGGDGDDSLYGGAGHDMLAGGTGADYMEGNDGDDYYVVDDAGDVVNENSGEGNDTLQTTLASYILVANVEHLEFIGIGDFTGEGNELNNHIYGAAGNDALYGHDGHDMLSGNGGDDSLYGGAGHDTLVGGTGADYMEGNAGDDAYIVDNAGDTVVELSGEGDFDIVYTSLSTYTLPDEIENLQWNTSGSFTATGNALDNIIWSGGSNDSLSGGDGDDEINASAGNDTLNGGDGDDYLIGSAGADTYTGGAGADLIQIGFFETGLGAAADRITDFATGVDTVDVSAWDANRNVAGNQAFTFVGSAAFSGTAGELRAYFDGVDTRVQADRNGDSIADFEIYFTGNVSLVGSDFVL